MYISISGGCIGCGACVALAPEVFELNAANQARVHSQSPQDPDVQAAVRKAEQYCPKQIIFADAEE